MKIDDKETKNEYQHPVDLTDNVRMTGDESPVHIKNLKHAVDFITKEGTAVKAAAAGIVVAIKSDSNIGGPDRKFYNDGNYIIIKHKNGEFSAYEHLQYGGVLVKLGQEVEKGEPIARSGATGYLAHLGPHLHFCVGAPEKENEYEQDFYFTLKIRWEA